MGKASVLIVEDEWLIALDLQLFVEALGLAVCGIADTRSRAVALARAQTPDLILADVRLKNDQDGIGTVEEILGFSDAAVIFVIANPERLAERGVHRFPVLAKPFHRRAIEDAILAALAGRRA